MRNAECTPLAPEEEKDLFAAFPQYLSDEEEALARRFFEPFVFFAVVEKNVRRCVCTSCMEGFPTDREIRPDFFKIKHKGVCECPNCGQRATLLAMGKYRNFEHLHSRQRAVQISVWKDWLLVQAGYVIRRFDQEDLGGYIRFEPFRRYAFAPGRRVGWKAKTYSWFGREWWTDGMWEKMDRMEAPFYNVTGIWIEEASETERGDFNQLDIRLRTNFPYYLQMILTFNPISVTHWLKARFFDTRDERARVDESTFRDNRFLPEENIRTMEGFRDTDPYYYQVYFLGQWGVTGKTVFDAQAISRRLEELEKPVAQGLFVYDYDGLRISNIRWEETQDGPVVIYHPPEEGRPYVIGGDTAGEGSDWFTGQVLDNTSGRQAAKLRHQYDEDVYARQMYCLGMHYNQALLGVETNFSTFPVKELARLGYHRQFVREREDTYKGGVKGAYGFRTDGLTRPVILSGLIEALRGHYDLIEDRETLEELLTFVREPKTLRPQAEQGAHDDLVMALAIAFYIRPQQAMAAVGREAPGVEWTRDMWEDYYGAGEAGRQYLIAKWGRPKYNP